MPSVCPTCSDSFSDIDNHYYRFPDHKPEEWSDCYSCGDRFRELGQHWRLSSCEYPDLSGKQKDVVVGSLLGDGTLNNRGGRPRFAISSITEEYLEHLRNIFGYIGTDVHLVTTAEEQCKHTKKFHGNGNIEDYHDIYRFGTRKIPALQQFTHWYSTGEKRFPHDLELNPTKLKCWYVDDGSYVTHDNKNYIFISNRNEQDRRRIVEDILSTSGFEVGWWEDGGFALATADTDRFFDYIGSPPPGFEYKWPNNY